MQTNTFPHLVRVKETQDCYYQLGEEEQREAERKLKRRKGMNHKDLKYNQVLVQQFEQILTALRR